MKSVRHGVRLTTGQVLAPTHFEADEGALGDVHKPFLIYRHDIVLLLLLTASRLDMYDSQLKQFTMDTHFLGMISFTWFNTGNHPCEIKVQSTSAIFLLKPHAQTAC